MDYEKYNKAMGLVKLMDEMAKYYYGSIEANFDEQAYECIIELRAMLIYMNKFDITEFLEYARIIDSIDISTSRYADEFTVTITISCFEQSN